MSRLLVDHLRRRAGADEGVEARDGAAGDGDEAEREERPGNDRPAAAGVLGQRRHLELGVHADDADREQEDGADLGERAEIAARRQQQPHRQHRGHEAVDAERDDDLRPREIEEAGEPAGRSG